MRILVTIALTSVFVVSPWSQVPASAEDGKWEVVNREEGVTVSRKTVAGRDLPVFRGSAKVNASIYVLLGILQDFDRHCEWQHGCKEAKLIEKSDDYRRVSYNRTDAPWPVDDRDVILGSTVTVELEKQTVMIRFKAVSHRKRPEVDGVIRMQRLRGYYMLTALGPDTTRVQYQVDADPGGWLPDWVVSMASEDIPLNTLRNLRKQVGKVGSQYEDLVGQWRTLAKFGKLP